MARKAKKKTPHWTKLPRPKLVARAKRLEQLLDRAKVQLAEMRETKLLNERGQADRLIENLRDDRRQARIDAALFPWFPWECRDDAGPGNNQTEGG